MEKNGKVVKPLDTALTDNSDHATGLLSDDERKKFVQALSRSIDEERPELVEYVKKLSTPKECKNQFSVLWQSLLMASSPQCAAELLEKAMAWSQLDANEKLALPNPLTAILLNPALVADDDYGDDY